MSATELLANGSSFAEARIDNLRVLQFAGEWRSLTNRQVQRVCRMYGVSRSTIYRYLGGLASRGRREPMQLHG